MEYVTIKITEVDTMSVESAKAFIERMTNDGEFREKIGKAKDKEERIKIVKEAGFDFKLEEIQSVRGELSDELLDDATGGTDWSGGGDCDSHDLRLM